MLNRLFPLAALLLAAMATATGADRPNILWITWEDCGPLLGCYGDKFARTPVLDAVAKESVRYTQAFAYTGVCAPSRSCLITSVYPPRLGSHHMRSTTRLPEAVKCFPEYLRAAGYYCSNNAKQDYNFRTPPTVWDESSDKAHWRQRAPGQPFFSVFNFMTTHESRVFGEDAKREAVRKKLAPDQRHADADAPIPPIHPDIPEFRREWAWYYDNVSLVDSQVGEVLAQLRADKLDEDTIVFFFADHGTGLPDIKMWAWNASLRVPFLVRFPQKWQHLAPSKPGTTSDRLVSFVDFAPTVLSLCELSVPASMQGSAFLGAKAGEPRRYVYGGKDRQGERYDTVRYAHDGHFHYLRNFQPHLPWGQYISYLDGHASFRAWVKLNEEGRLSGLPARFFQTKPAEELYDTQADPWETRNLVDDPRFASELQRLRTECEKWMLHTGDLGLLPESELLRRAEGTTPYDYALDPQRNPLPQLLAAAKLANARDPALLPQLLALTKEADPAVRWWGVTGLVALKEKAAPAVDPLRKLAGEDASPDVRVAAAEALAICGHHVAALETLIIALKDDSACVRLAALNVLDRLGPRAQPALPAILKANLKDPASPDAAGYVGRMVEYLPQPHLASMKRSTSVSIVLIALTAGVLAAVYFVTNRTKKTAQSAMDLVKSAVSVTPEVTITSIVSRQKTSRNLELASVSKDFPVEQTYSGKWVGSSKRLVLRGEYTAKAGFDLRERFCVQIDESTRKVRADFPAPKILSVQQNSYKVVDDEGGWWNMLTEQDHAEAVNAMNDEARKQALALDILQSAKNLLRRQLHELAQKAGQEWEINFRDEVPLMVVPDTVKF